MNLHKFLAGNGIYFPSTHRKRSPRQHQLPAIGEKECIYRLVVQHDKKRKRVFFKATARSVSGGSPYELQQAINEVYDSVCEGKSTSFRTHFLTNSRICFCRFEKLRTFRKSLSTNSPNRSSFLFFLSTSRFSSPTVSRAYTHTPPHTHSANFRFLPSPFTSRITL